MTQDNVNLTDQLNKKLLETVEANAELIRGSKIYNSLIAQIAENEEKINKYIEQGSDITDDLVEKFKKSPI